MKGKKHLVGAAVALIALSLIPIPYLAAPEWHVTVVDEFGAPISGMTVRLSWKNYSTESEGHEEDRVTDSDGSVAFPARKGWASSLQRLWFSSLMATSLAHASFGPHATVFAFGQDREGSAINGGKITDWTGKPVEMRSEIIAQPR